VLFPDFFDEHGQQKLLFFSNTNTRTNYFLFLTCEQKELSTRIAMNNSDPLSNVISCVFYNPFFEGCESKRWKFMVLQSLSPWKEEDFVIDKISVEFPN